MNKLTRDDSFSRMHPVVNFIYFVFQIGIFIVCKNPFLQFIALVGAIGYSFFLFGVKAIKNCLVAIPFALLVAMINPLFSHEGMTILWYFPNGNALTLESIFYGVGVGLLILCSILWFSIFSVIMTTDKWVHLLSKPFPKLALLITMIMRFIPQLLATEKEMAIQEVGKNPFRRISMLITWGLENSIDTADSMEARGYGMGRRTHFQIRKMKLLDWFVLVVSLCLGSVVAILIFCDEITFYYYPMVQYGTSIGNHQIYLLIGYGAYSLLSFLPLLLEMEESVRWNYLRSKI